MDNPTRNNQSTRNPPWSRDECILALDVYINHRPDLPSHDSPEITNLVGAVNSILEVLNLRAPVQRNRNSIYMKLANFQAIDPRYMEQGKKGLGHGSKIDRLIFHQFAKNPQRLITTAEKIRAASYYLEKNSQPDQEISEAPEGRLLTSLHVIRERNQTLVKKKKRDVVMRFGKLACEGCAFDFSWYGERGEDYIEVHHIEPLSSLTPGNTTRLSNLALLCSNCHRMIHRKLPWLTVEQLKQIAPNWKNGHNLPQTSK